MTWEQKLQAMKALGEASLLMRHPGDWFVHHPRVEKYDGATMEGECVTNANSPEAAVEKHWQWLTSYQKERECISVRNNIDHPSIPLYYRWNGFMWQPWDVRR